MFAKIAAQRRGFTLIELLVVIVIIAVLAMIAIPKFTDAGKRSKEASLRSDLSLLRSAVATYNTDTGAFPTTLADLTATTAPANGVDKAGATVTIAAADWHGPYIQTGLPTDPITNGAFSYTGTGATGIGTVKSTSAATGLDGTVYNTW